MPPTPPDLADALAGRFTLLRPLGEGGSAIVYLADDLRHQRRVALKVLKPEVAATLGADRFHAEIRTAARLNHPCITPVFDSGQAGPFIYFVMPVIEGDTLRDRLRAEERLNLADTLTIARDLADALEYAHEHNVIHRDLKPDNVLLHGRHAQLTDFGISAAIESAGPGRDLTGQGWIGTPAYMSPEQASPGTPCGPRTDVYGLGCVVYEMLTGAPPFHGPSAPVVLARVLAEAPAPISAARSDLPAAVDAVVARALAKSPDDRYGSAGDFVRALQQCRGQRASDRRAVRAPRLRRALLVAAGTVAVGTAALLFWISGEGERWARDEAVPQIRQFIAEEEWDSAWQLAQQVEARAPHSAAFAEVLPQLLAPVTITSEPEGAQVWRRDYSAPADAAWVALGTTPLPAARLPKGASRLRLELDGHRPVDVAHADPVDRHFVLVPARGEHDGFVSVAGADVPFELQRFEVTNAEFARFVAAGGYRTRTHWRHAFRDNGRVLTHEQAMARFVDDTGRPGPSTWIAGTFPSGQDTYPVAGLSWYEAAAFASFSNASLPAYRHWLHAQGLAGSALGTALLPASNLGGTLLPGQPVPAAAPVGRFQGVGPYGTFDMAGNVREWVENAAGNRRVILGGDWQDSAHVALVPFGSMPPMDRSPTNGLRLARYQAPAAALAAARADLPEAPATRERPASSGARTPDGYRSLFDYDSTPLDAKVESFDPSPTWIREKISLRTAYDDDRLIVYLFRPLGLSTSPTRTVVYWPGVSAATLDSLDTWSPDSFDFLIASGRAVAFPILKGTFERRARLDNPDMRSIEFRDRVVEQVKDVRRTVDYLDSRRDLTLDGLAYYGHSWGAAMAPVVLTMERRFRAAVLYLPGLLPGRPRAEINPLTYSRHVTVPVLALSGRIDPVFAFDVHAQPFVAMLGTPAPHKRHVVTWTGHWLPRARLVREVLDWLDSLPSVPLR